MLVVTGLAHWLAHSGRSASNTWSDPCRSGYLTCISWAEAARSSWAAGVAFGRPHSYTWFWGRGRGWGAIGGLFCRPWLISAINDRARYPGKLQSNERSSHEMRLESSRDQRSQDEEFSSGLQYGRSSGCNGRQGGIERKVHTGN
jgi:hypothetical protein